MMGVWDDRGYRYAPCFSNKFHCELMNMALKMRSGETVVEIRSMKEPNPEEPDCLTGPRNCRREARVEDSHSYAYETCEGPAQPVQQGRVFTLNRSAHGALLLMGDAPREHQLIQLYSTRLGWRRSTMVYQVRWTRPLRVTSNGELFLVGCRLTIGTGLS